MIRILATILIFIVFPSDSKAEDIKVDSFELAKKYSEEFEVSIRPEDSEHFECQTIHITFPSIRNEIGIQDVQLFTKESNGKYSTKIAVDSHRIGNPRDTAQDSWNGVFICIPKEQISKSIVQITYGHRHAMCYRDRIGLYIKAFLTESK